MSKFKYLGCVLDESGPDEAECLRKVMSGRIVARVLSDPMILQLECTRVLHEALLVPVLLCGSETMI